MKRIQLNLPSLETIEQLHMKYAKDHATFDLINTHCRIITAIATQLMEKNNLEIDRQLVIAGSMLHDIGAYAFDTRNGLPSAHTYVRHGLLGYELLKTEGYPENLCRIASHHTGVGITKLDIETQELPLPHEDFLAETIEERLVMYADKFHSKTPRFNSFDSYKKTVEQYGEWKPAAFEALAAEFGIPDLEALAIEFNQPIV